MDYPSIVIIGLIGREEKRNLRSMGKDIDLKIDFNQIANEATRQGKRAKKMKNIATGLGVNE